MKRRLKINGVIMFLAFTLLVIFPAAFFRKNEAVSYFWDQIAEVFGVTFILLGQILRVSARGYKADNSGNGSSLITTGPYSLVRNPMYLGIFLIGFGVVLMLFKWWVLAVFVVFFVIRYIRLIFQEEKKLVALFPKDYPVYCRKVNHRIYPPVSDIFKRDMISYLPLKAQWIKKEIGSIVTVLLVTLSVELFSDIKDKGFSLFLKESMGIFVVIALFIYFVSYLIRSTARKNKDATAYV